MGGTVGTPFRRSVSAPRLRSPRRSQGPLPDAPAPARLLRALPGTQGTQQSPTHVPITKAPHRSPLRSRSASCRHRHRHSRGHNSRRRSSLGHDGPMRPGATRTPARRKPRLASLGCGDRCLHSIKDTKPLAAIGCSIPVFSLENKGFNAVVNCLHLTCSCLPFRSAPRRLYRTSC